MGTKRSAKQLIKELRVPAKGNFRLRRFDPDATFGLPDKATARKQLATIHTQLDELQEKLYAQGEHAVLVVLQAMDAGGKDSTIRSVFGPLNPQGVRVIPFKAPTAEELAHDFLWRIHRQTPAKGMIHVFNRSHYEDVLVVRVHQWASKEVIKQRYEQINAFEKNLSENGVTIVKFYLHISKDEQRQRFQDRLDRPDKHWKFNIGDLKERELWGDYMDAFQVALTRCSTPWAPWYVIPANHKWARDVAIGRILVQTLKGLKLKYPEPEAGLDSIVIPD